MAGRTCRCPSCGNSGGSGGSTADKAKSAFCATRQDAWLPMEWMRCSRSSGMSRGELNAQSHMTLSARGAIPRPRANDVTQ